MVLLSMERGNHLHPLCPWDVVSGLHLPEGSMKYWTTLQITEMLLCRDRRKPWGQQQRPFSRKMRSEEEARSSEGCSWTGNRDVWGLRRDASQWERKLSPFWLLDVCWDFSSHQIWTQMHRHILVSGSGNSEQQGGFSALLLCLWQPLPAIHCRLVISHHHHSPGNSLLHPLLEGAQLKIQACSSRLLSALPPLCSLQGFTISDNFNPTKQQA